MKPKVSVILPCYNGEETLSIQLNALSKQQLDEAWEVIFVDNKSTDNSVKIAKTFKIKIPCLRIIEATNRQGQPYALNIGVKAADARKILLCDADDEVGQGWLSAMSKALSEHSIVASRLDTHRLNSPMARKVRGDTIQTKGLISYDYPPYLPHAAGASLGFKRSLYYAVEGFDEEFPALHDTDFCWKAQNLGEKIHFVEDAVVHYRYRETNRENFRQAMFYGEYNVKIYKKYKKNNMPAIHWQKGIRTWINLLKIRRLIRLRHSDLRNNYLWQLAWQMGRLKGCVKYRVLAF
jgi:GT2 family glycosyltransferase